jgi:hypothetical protein
VLTVEAEVPKEVRLRVPLRVGRIQEVLGQLTLFHDGLVSEGKPHCRSTVTAPPHTPSILILGSQSPLSTAAARGISPWPTIGRRLSHPTILSTRPSGRPSGLAVRVQRVLRTYQKVSPAWLEGKGSMPSRACGGTTVSHMLFLSELLSLPAYAGSWRASVPGERGASSRSRRVSSSELATRPGRPDLGWVEFEV